MPDIRFIRLKTGEDLVAKIESENNGKVYVLTHPMRLMYMLDTSNPTSKSFGLTLQPWVYPSITTQDSFEIPWVDIQTMAKCSRTLLRMFNKAIDYYYGPFEEKEVNISPKPVKKKEEKEEDVLEIISETDRQNVESFVSESLQRISKKSNGNT